VQRFPFEREHHFHLSNPLSPEVHVSGLSEELLKAAMQAVIAKDKFTVTAAAFADDGTGIRFEAKSKSGQVLIKGLFCDPQGSLDLEAPEQPAGDAPADDVEPAANEDEDEEPH
jgi:hypothetical protein